MVVHRIRKKKITHVFTESGNGKAPFKFLGVQENAFDLGDGTNKAGGICDHCGTGIRWEFILQSTDGNRFVVGSDCIHKSGDSGLISLAKAEVNKRQRERRAKKKEEERLARLQKQRDRNGGFTNGEWETAQFDNTLWFSQQFKNRAKKRLAPWADQLEPLDTNGGGFVHGMVAMMRKGEMPKGRAPVIIIEILAKQKGHKGSKAFKVEQAKLSAEWAEM